MLTIYNSLTRQKQPFVPREPGKISLYVCGMTVYDWCHIGHARVMVNFDFMVRYFRYRGFAVTYVRNITDIDDKIIQRALENQESIQQLTTRYIEAMHADAARLHVISPTYEPRATEYIVQMQAMITALLAKGYAYVSNMGDVIYRVEAFKAYGKLGHKNLDDLYAGARVAVTDDKESPLDFVLWKKAKPSEPYWDSPWGPGRPGWHIECSAMASECLGKHFDIHGGGTDLKFPHHENEIAQAEAANDTTFVNYWMHVGFVTIHQEKMSKSLNNFFTIREVLERYHPEVIRYFLLASHYRSPIDYSETALAGALAALKRFYTSLRDLPLGEANISNPYEADFITAMDDDFNTPEALAVLFALSHELNRIREVDRQKAGNLGALLKKLGGVLGLFLEEPTVFLQHSQGNDPAEITQIQTLIAEREAARAAKNWQLADALRVQLENFNVILEDSAAGTQWRRG